MSFLEQLPEVIEQIGRDVKAITVVLGKGRPDKPDTTGDKITGEEPKIKGNDAIPDIGPKNLRPPAMMWTTSDPWPDRV
ncbi:MAG: hypothetical protein KH127_00585 [Haemophilus parainfluenzae]|nr:hypothetical protein [Haemophilus parainfluenzae]